MGQAQLERRRQGERAGDALGLGALAAHARDEEARGSRRRPSLLDAETEADRGGFR